MIEVFSMVSAGFAAKRLPTTSVLRHQAVLFGWILRLTHRRWWRIKSRKLMLCAISMFGMQQVTGILVLRPFW